MRLSSPFKGDASQEPQMSELGLVRSVCGGVGVKKLQKDHTWAFYVTTFLGRITRKETVEK